MSGSKNSFDKLTGGVFSLTGKISAYGAKALVGRVSKSITQHLSSGKIAYPQLASDMAEGGSFSDEDFESKTGELISCLYTDLHGNKYHFHKNRFRKWQKLGR